MNPTDHGATPLRAERDLFAPFEAAFAQTEARIGLEAEKFGIHADGRPLTFGAADGIPALLSELASRFGWIPDRETPDGPVLALTRGMASITLEPGSQLELSGSPLLDVHEIVREVELHKSELAQLQSARGMHWLGLGFHPFARESDLDWVPKARYPVMRKYLPTRGTQGPNMMRRTATVQANFDVRSEADAMGKLRTAIACSPVVQALFANSTVYDGVRHGVKSHRAEVWLDVDPDRSGLLPLAWREGASVGDYVRWALSVPMFIVKRDGHPIDLTHLTFGEYLKNGSDGTHATLADWEMHLNTLFPEVRLKRTLEVRSADSVPAGWSAALPALWAGILYDDDACRAAGELTATLGYDAWVAARPAIATLGLGATVAGRPVRDLAVSLLAIASEGLARRARHDDQGRDERMYVEPLRALAERGESIGDAIVRDWSPGGPDANARLMAAAAY